MAQTSRVPAQLQEITLDPFTCLTKRNLKYASECTEVFLADKNAEALSDNFRKFPNLEVCWFNTNRLSRLDNLETNFRIREVFLQDNSLVSLSGLKNCKFLRVLLASNNQIRNLEKQLDFISSRFLFLKKLELSGNPIADEPEYRLRLIYHAPQVELLDCAVVTGPQRAKAAVVVPSLDNVSGPPPKSARTKKPMSQLEQDCFREKRQILERNKKREEDSLTQMFSSTSVAYPAVLRHKRFTSNAQAWSSPREFIAREQPRPTAWEMGEMTKMVETIAGKDELTQSDVISLCKQLSQGGVHDMGRSLTRPDVFGALVPASAMDGSRKASPTLNGNSGYSATPRVVDGKPHALQVLVDPEATMPTKEVAKYLMTLEWHRHDEATLGTRIEQLYVDAKRADLAGDKAQQSLLQTAALRLGGAQDRKKDFHSSAKQEVQLSARKPRADVFQQSMIRPHRLMDELTGRNRLDVVKTDRSLLLGG